MGEARRKKLELKRLMDSLPQTVYGSQRIESNGKVTFEYLPEGYIALNRELSTGYHPTLERILANHPVEEVDIRLADICTYCCIALDGIYDLAQRDKLCFILAGRLEAMREMPKAQTIIPFK